MLSDLPRRRRLPTALAVAAAVALPGSAALGDPAPVIGPPAKGPHSSCFGAAARDPQRPCADRRLRLTVFPAPEDAQLEPNAACTPVDQTRILLPCAFGVRKQQADDVIALVGDSHASHWRAAVAVVAQARNWRGISITRSSCPFSRAVAKLDEPARRQCIRWKRQVVKWFRAHRQVHTVFVSEHSGGQIQVPDGASVQAAQVKGYTDVWAALPATITRIFVIRDTPRNTTHSVGCIEHAVRARRPAGPACAVPRRSALPPDPATIAAARLGGHRVKVIDLTSFMCSRRLCLPVIGGALVHRDSAHLTQTFATSLGPYMLRQVNARGVPARKP